MPLALDSLPASSPGPPLLYTGGSHSAEKGGQLEHQGPSPQRRNPCVYCHIFAVCGSDLAVQVLLHKLSRQTGERLTFGAWALTAVT